MLDSFLQKVSQGKLEKMLIILKFFEEYANSGMQFATTVVPGLVQ